MSQEHKQPVEATVREHNSKSVMPELGLTDDEVSKIIETLRSMTK